MTLDLADTVKGLAEKAVYLALNNGDHIVETIAHVLEPAIRELIAKEREACAKIVKQLFDEGQMDSGRIPLSNALKAIRARGGKS
jgi:hypothetical protein